MKFLCVDCDEPMKILRVDGPSEGSLSAVFECPACGWKFALLTNPWETQLLKSLDVRVGGKSGAGEPMAALRSSLSSAAAREDSSAAAAPAAQGSEGAAGMATGERPSCPFAGMIAQQQAAQAGAPAGPAPAGVVAGASSNASGVISWSEEARLRLERVPSFVREMAKNGVEEFARSQGLTEVTGEVMDAARKKFGM